MKSIILILFIFILCASNNVQAQTYACSLATSTILPPTPHCYQVKNIVTDFGANPNDLNSDQAAFERAAFYFRKNGINGKGGNGQLIIPPGTYYVGQQDQGCHYQYLFGHQVFVLGDATNFTITGVSGANGPPVIRYLPCLKFGSFDPATGGAYLPYHSSPQCSGFSAQDHLATLGNCFEFFHSQFITIENLELDGNIDEARIGGSWAADYAGIQAAHDGLFLQSCRNITLTNLNVHHFGLDGIQIESENTYPYLNSSIDGCKFNNNNRDGLSWGGGSNLSIIHSQFNFNGTGSFSSAMASGVDIELRDQFSADITNGYFFDVNFEHNFNSGLVSSIEHDVIAHIHDFYFEACTFIGSDPRTGAGYALWPSMRNAEFQFCWIYGKLVTPMRDNSYPNDGAYFMMCTFSDVYNGKNYVYDASYAVDMGPIAGNVLRTFSNCTFERHCSNLFLSAVGGDITFDNDIFFDYNNHYNPFLGTFCMDRCYFNNNSNGYIGPYTNNYFDVCYTDPDCPNLFAWTEYAEREPDCPPYYSNPIVGQATLFCTTCSCYTAQILPPPGDCLFYAGERNASTTVSEKVQNIIIAPNPAHDQVNISGVTSGENITVYDIFGKKLMLVKSSGDITDLDISKLQPGIYFLNGENQFIGKFVKQ